MICKNCKNKVSDNFCSNCGQPLKLSKINGEYVLFEIGSMFNFQKGMLFTVKELLIRPGKIINNYIDNDRSRLVKPIIFLLIWSLFYTLASRYFHFQDGYINFHGEADSIKTQIFNWIQNNYGYANILISLCIAIWVKLLFFKHHKNIFEIFVLLCYVTGFVMLLYGINGIVVAVSNLSALSYSAFLGMAYYSYAVGQFFNKAKFINYLLAIVSYILGLITFVGLVLGLGVIADWVV